MGNTNVKLIQGSEIKHKLKQILPSSVIQLRDYKPLNYIRSLMARKNYQKYYEGAKAAWKSQSQHQSELTAKLSKALELQGIGETNVSELGPQEIHQEMDNLLEAFEGLENVLWMSDNHWKAPTTEDLEKADLPQYAYLNHEKLVSLKGLAEYFVDDEVIAPLERHLQCHVRLVAMLAYRTYGQSGVDRNSMMWHFDNQPEHSLKIMMYPHEVKRNSGEFEYLLGSHHDAKLTPGFGNSRITDSAVIKKYQKIRCVGSKGTLYYFNNNGFHRGGNVKNQEAMRTVFLACYRPSKIPAKTHLRQYGFGGYHQATWGVDPNKVWWSGK